MRTWPTIGRDEEIDAVTRAWENGNAVLRGGPGIGKTRVARQALGELGDPPSSFVWVTGTRSAATIPLGAFAGVIPIPAEPGLELAAAIHHAAQTLTASVRGNERRTVVVDDAHRLDDASATLLLALARDPRVRLLAIVDAQADLSDALRALVDGDDCTLVDLKPLSVADVTEMAAHILDRHVDRFTGQRLWELSQGAPMIVRELLEARPPAPDATGLFRFYESVPLSPTLRSFVATRLDTCDGAQLYVLRLLAIAESLRSSVMAAEREGLLVDGLVERGLVEVSIDDGESYLSIAHPLVAAFLREHCPPMTAFQIKERLLHLTTGATRPTDLVRRIDWQLETAQEVSVDALRTAVQIVVGPNRDRLRMRKFGRELLQREQSKAAAIVILNGLVRQGRAEEALDLVEVARDLPGSAAEQGDLAFVEIDALAWILGDLERARVAVRKWKDELGPHACFAEAHFAQALAVRGELDQATAIAMPLLTHQDRYVQLRAVTPATAPMLMAGQTQRVLDLTAELIEGVQDMPSPSDAPLYVGTPRVLAMLLAGELSDAEALLTLATMFWAETGDSTDHGMTELGMGRLRLLQGRPRAAVEVLRDATSHFSEYADYGRRSWSYALLAEALVLTGDIEGAKRAAVAAEQTRDPHFVMYDLDGRRAIAWVQAADGQIGAARDALVDCAAVAQAAGMLPYELMARYDALRLGATNGLGDFARLARVMDGHWPELFHRHARHRTNPEELALVSQDFAAVGANLFAAEAAANAGEHFRRLSRDADAARAFARSQELRRLCEDARTPALLMSGRAHPLTGRESEIALMASRGAATKAIALALGLSARTVDNTLGRVYAKLGVNSRAELVELFGSRSNAAEIE
jgi:DNA-binding CsgD family transcriptional regulator